MSGAAASEPAAKPKIFISYGRGDDRIGPDDGDANYYYDPARSFTRRLYDTLTAAGLDMWWDRDSLPHRELPFLHDIREAVNACDKVLLVVGTKGMASDYVRAEYEYALSVCKPVVTILRDGDYGLIPASLKHQNTIDFCDLAHFVTKAAELVSDLCAGAVPLGPLHNVRHELPEWYVRRAEDMDAVSQLLMQDGVKPVVVSSKHKTTTLHGMGGIGKSTLANALALDCGIRRFFPDGVFWLELGKDPNLATRMGDIGEAFGDLRAEYPDDQRAASRLSHVLRDKAALLILDNVWDVAHAKPFNVVNSRCRLLITTRKPRLHTLLGGVEHELDTLNDNEALQLFAKRLNIEVAAFSEEQTATLTEISHQLGGLVLAVEIAAGKISERGLSFAPRYLQRLQTTSDPFADLQLAEDDKDHNVALSLKLSYDDLSTDLQRRFRALGIFAPEGTFNVAAAGAVWDDADAYHVEEMLNELVQVSLVTRTEEDGQTRYFQHPLLRAYAQGLLTQEGEPEGAASRHFAYYAQLHGDHDSNNDEKRHPRIKADLPNVLVALGWGYLLHLRDAGILTLALVPYLNLHGPAALEDELLARAEALFQRLKDKKGLAATWYMQGVFRLLQDDLLGAEIFLDQALPLFEEFGLTINLAATLKSKGDIAVRRADLAGAHSFFERAQIEFEKVEDSIGVATILRSLGEMSMWRHEYEEADTYFEQALAWLGNTNDRTSLARILYNRGELRFRQLDFPGALEYATQSESLYADIGDYLGMASTRHLKGEISLHRGDGAEAIVFFVEEETMYREAGSRYGMARALYAQGNVSAMMGDLVGARTLLSRARALQDEIGDTIYMAPTCKVLGDISARQGDLDGARVEYNAAQKLYDARGDQRGIASIKLAHGDLCVAERNGEDAKEHYLEAMQVYKEIGDPVGVAETWYRLYRAAREVGRISEACGFLALALKLAAAIPSLARHPGTSAKLAEFEQLCGSSQMHHADDFINT